MNALSRMCLSLLVSSLISMSPITMHSAAGQETLALESAQNSQPAPENMSPDVARKHFLAVLAARPRSSAWAESHESNNIQSQ